jgi:hypothetical protein
MFLLVPDPLPIVAVSLTSQSPYGQSLKLDSKQVDANVCPCASCSFVRDSLTIRRLFLAS